MAGMGTQLDIYLITSDTNTGCATELKYRAVRRAVAQIRRHRTESRISGAEQMTQNGKSDRWRRADDTERKVGSVAQGR